MPGRMRRKGWQKLAVQAGCKTGQGNLVKTLLMPIQFHLASEAGQTQRKRLRGHLVAPSRSSSGLQNAHGRSRAAEGVVVAVVERHSCQQLAQLLRCAQGPESTQPRYNPFPVTSLQRVIKA
ncbi:hypothetical protein LEMLEM_LOCUS12495 [Lemmus lemmus]